MKMMKTRFSLLVILLMAVSAMLIHASVTHRTDVEDALINSYVEDTSSMLSESRVSSSKTDVVSRNIAVAWKGELTGEMMHASLSEGEANELGVRMSAGESIDEALSQMRIAMGVSAR